MSRCICVNISKEEYLDFGELPESSYRDASACNTVEYFLGTEWAGDIVVFAFEDMEPGVFCPEEDENLFSYAVHNFDERCVLNSVPSFRYLVNTTKNIYYDRTTISKGADGSYFDPISLLLSAAKDQDVLDLDITECEASEIGMWSGNTVIAVNNIAAYPGSTCFVPSFKCEVIRHSKSLSGLNIVVTGVFPSYDRYEVEELIKNAGGTMQKSVTKKTDFLVVADKPGKTKLAKAREYGIKELTADEFMNML